MLLGNVWYALSIIVRDGFSKGFLGFLINIDKLGNALCSGSPRCTVSARVGLYCFIKKNLYWRFLQWCINSAFYPIDGKDHCYKAYLHEKSRGIREHRRGSDIALAALGWLVIVSCLILTPLIWVISFFVKGSDERG